MLYAVTSYFNPAGYRSRLANYRLFRRRLAVPLVAVELSFDGRFELGPGDADRLLQVRGADVMFQKERLLNLALKALPDDCQAVAWLDCDVLMADGWVEAALRALEERALVQLYASQYNLSADARPERPREGDRVLFGTAVAKKLATGEMTLDDFSAEAAPVAGTAWGLAWAARRELLSRHGFYDACILGSGDAALVCAAVGGFERPREALRMSDRRHRHYLAWAEPFHRDVQGRIGYLDLPILHLWHGEAGRRRYRERHQEMAAFDFDPVTDIGLTEEGCWRWTSAKPELHAYVARYFPSRREDDSSASDTGAPA
ncbi:MAG: hypothetical protein GC160_09365 [Acidobacteria bacterium]|nr:hypothetical protein [Acidobacteriota bacterium]